MKAVVTGGAGFIGSHLVERLLQDNHDVVVIDNLASGRMANLAHVIDYPNLTFGKVDVAEIREVQPLVDGADWVFHLAGLADIVPSIENPLRYHTSNVDGTVSILEAARAAGVKRFVYAASSSCYGIPDEYPTIETAPIRAMYPYALTKNIGEQCVLHWNKVYGLPCVALRLFNVYGPRSRSSGTYGAVFGVFLAQKLAGQPYTVVGDGEQTRDFTFVTDVVDAFVRAAESDVEGQAMNVGSGHTYSINYLVSLLGGESVHIPKRPGEPDCSFADTQKISSMLGWKPRFSFEDGVQIMLDSVEQWREAKVWDPNSISEATQTWFKYLGDTPQKSPIPQPVEQAIEQAVEQNGR